MDLGTLGGTYSTPTGINDDGVVVGSSTTSAKAQHAFVWTPTNGMVDLGTFGDPAAPGVRLRTSVATPVSNTGKVRPQNVGKSCSLPLTGP
jgi:probable HAF family extracellular repeat protein